MTTAASSSEMSLSFAFLSSAKKSRDGNAGDRVVSGKTLAGGQTEEMARGQSPLCEALVPKKEKENVDKEEGRDTADVHSISDQASARNSCKQGTAAEAFLSLLDIQQPVAQMPQKLGVRGGELSVKGCVNRSDHLLSMAFQSFAMLSVRKCECSFCECECDSVCMCARSL